MERRSSRGKGVTVPVAEPPITTSRKAATAGIKGASSIPVATTANVGTRSAGPKKAVPEIKIKEEREPLVKEVKERKSALVKEADNIPPVATPQTPTKVTEANLSPSKDPPVSLESRVDLTPQLPYVSDAVVEAPEPAGEEVVLNRRGMPQRQRKRNRFYFDDDMVTPETSSRKSITKTKIKEEPVDEIRPESPIFSHVEMSSHVLPPAPAPTKRSYTKKVYSSSHPTPSQVAQAVTQMVKPRVNPVGRPSKAAKAQALQRPEPSTSSGWNKKSVASPKDVGKIRKESRNARLSTPMKARKNSKSDPFLSRSYHGNESAYEPVRSPPTLKVKHTGHHGRSNPTVKPRDMISFIKIEPDIQPKGSPFARGSRVEYEKRSSQNREKERRQREKDIYKQNQRMRRVSSPDEILLGIPNEPPTDILVESEQPRLDKKTAQEISLRLRNLLKLPKAHKWVCYEWFYSNIDKVLFDGENDFQICFKESFPQLKTRKLTRVEWTKLRRLMGKPRRCSYAFFDEEREELARRRQKIRMIQQRKVTDFNYKELPDEIPLQLVIGTKVTTRLRRPQDGLFTGTIEGVDTSNNTYRITFDRNGLGTHSIPDYEVLSNEPPETVSTSSFALKIPRRSCFTGNQFKLNAALGDELNKYAKSPFPVDGMLGGFPIRLLDMIVRLSKLLKAKREKILQLKELNVEAEKLRSYNKPYNDDFRLRYARVILDLESMNKESEGYLNVVEQYCVEIAPDNGVNQILIPQQVKEQCDQEADLVVKTYNTRQNREAVTSESGLLLITRLTSIMLQIKALSSGDRNLFELKSIKQSMKEIKASLEGKNLQIFQDMIEIPLNRIQAGLTYRQGGNSSN